VTYRLLTNDKVVPYDILYIVSNFQPTRAEVDFPIGLAGAMSFENFEKTMNEQLECHWER
jgi:hypothetical protein